MLAISSARSAKNVSKPAGAGKPNSRTGAAVAFQWVCTTPLGMWTNVPAGASTVSLAHPKGERSLDHVVVLVLERVDV